MTGSRVVLASLSAAMDGSFTAVADVSAAMATSGTTDQHRLIGGVAVMLHVERLGLGLPLRATGDADFGVPPHVLREPDLVDAIEALGYRKVLATDGNAGSTIAASLPSTCSSRRTDHAPVTPSRSARSSRARFPVSPKALLRPPVTVDIELLLTDGGTLSTSVALPDAVGMLALKTLVRTVRTEESDIGDLWRCLEIAAAEGVEPETFDSSKPLEGVRALSCWSLWCRGETSALTDNTSSSRLNPAAAPFSAGALSTVGARCHHDVITRPRVERPRPARRWSWVSARHSLTHEIITTRYTYAILAITSMIA